jgi:predicted aspartyl protease
MTTGACRVLFAWLFPLLLVAALPASADVPLDAAAIYAKIAAAAGAEPAAYRETLEFVSSNGTKMVERDYYRGSDHRLVYDTGPLHAESGTYKGDPWYMNENGQVVFDDPDNNGAPRHPAPPSVSAIHTPVEGYVIAALDARGRGTKEYVDAATWQVVRRDRITADGTIVSTYDDIRADNGRTFAHHIHVDDRASKVTTDMHVTSYDASDVAESDVAVPSPRRALVEFPPGVTSVDLPATFSGTQVFVRVMVGNRGLDFTLDTGAAGITIDSDVARELGVPQLDRRSSVAAGRYDTSEAIVPEMKVGSLTMRNVAVHVVPQGWEEAPGLKDVGLLEFDFLAELGVTIDYEHKRVTVVPGQVFQHPTDPRTIPVDVRIGSGQPRTTVAVNGVQGDRFILDTGGDGTFMIFDYFARFHPDAFKNQTSDQSSVRMQGIGGEFTVQRYSMSRIQFASAVFVNFVGYRIISKGAYESDEGDGVIGAGFLQLFTVSLDYVNSRVYLVPNRDGRAATSTK